jgi:hypothetical protein
VQGHEEKGVVGQSGVGGAANAGVGRAKLRRVVGHDWLRCAVARRFDCWAGDRLLGDVL